jgi:hypothetical protein
LFNVITYSSLSETIETTFGWVSKLLTTFCFWPV